MWNDIERLHHYHGDVPAEFRVLKIAEEVGEAAEALIGLRGLNKRKGTCRTRDDLLDELADVVITAAVAMAGVTDGAIGEARSHFGRRLQTITARTGTMSAAEPPSEDGHEPMAHRLALFPVSVKAVIVRDGKVVLLRNERDEWELPGGKLELGEDPPPPARLRQEIAEECGLGRADRADPGCLAVPHQRWRRRPSRDLRSRSHHQRTASRQPRAQSSRPVRRARGAGLGHAGGVQAIYRRLVRPAPPASTAGRGLPVTARADWPLLKLLFLQIAVLP